MASLSFLNCYAARDDSKKIREFLPILPDNTIGEIFLQPTQDDALQFEAIDQEDDSDIELEEEVPNLAYFCITF